MVASTDGRNLLDEQAELLEFEPTATMTMVNPNPYILYEECFAGRIMFFVPFKRYEVKVALGTFLVSRARDRWKNQQRNAKIERQHWAICMSSEAMIKREFGQKFADKDGNPRTKPLLFPGLIRADSPKGKEIIEQGLSWLDEHADDEELASYLKKYEHMVWDPEEDLAVKAGLKTPKSTEEDLTELSEEPTSVLKLILETPDKDWEPEQMMGYIKRYTGEEVAAANKGKKDWLIKKMHEVHATTKAAWNKAEVEYTED